MHSLEVCVVVLDSEAISQVCWFYDMFQRDYLIASVSAPCL